MSNYNSLKATIDANIKQNGNQEITGQILNSVLNQMVNILGTGYQFAGVATIATNPGTPDAKVFYIANGKGTYEKFGGLEVTEDDVVVLYWDTAWHKVATGIASQAKLSELIGYKLSHDYESTGNYSFNITLKGGDVFSVSNLTQAYSGQVKCYYKGSLVESFSEVPKNSTAEYQVTGDVDAISIYANAVGVIEITTNGKIKELTESVSGVTSSVKKAEDIFSKSVRFSYPSAGPHYFDISLNEGNIIHVKNETAKETGKVTCYYKKKQVESFNGVSAKNDATYTLTKDIDSIYIYANAEGAISIDYEGSLSVLENKVEDLINKSQFTINAVAGSGINLTKSFVQQKGISFLCQLDSSIDITALTIIFRKSGVEIQRFLISPNDSVRVVLSDDITDVQFYASSDRYSSSGVINVSFEEGELAEVKEVLGKVNERLDIIENKIPSYWEEYINEKMPSLYANIQDSALHGDSFIFLTDYHLESNAGMSHLVVKNIVNKCPSLYMVNGGDVINGSPTREASLEKHRTFESRFKDVRVFGVQGNHDTNRLATNPSEGGTVNLTESEVYTYFNKINEEKVVGDGGLSYYRDLTSKKLRYIYIDAKMEASYSNSIGLITDETITWMKDRMLELPADWTIVVISHQLLTSTGYSASGMRIHNAILEILGNLSATLAAVICGHCHVDLSNTDGGYLKISTTCDALSQASGTLTRTIGTISEQAFDVFSIDTHNRTIKAIRIGAGMDREWNY